MATRRTTSQLESKKLLELVIPRDVAKTRLQERIEKGLELKQKQVDTQEAFESLKHEFSKWNSFNEELLNRIFSNDDMAKEYAYWGAMMMSIGEPSLGKKIADLYDDINKKIHRIDSIIERLELIPLNTSSQSESSSPSSSAIQTRSKKVFVVHGRDEVSKTNLEVFLRELGLEPVVLHRQADEGMTIIEKFEKHSDVGYAFIILTPDEVAYLATEDKVPDNERNKEYRARPNVIFEFGYFVGKLSRSRVCCLYTGDVSLPSDVSGMIYKRYDKSIEDVAYSIIKDLKASGYAIAIN